MHGGLKSRGKSRLKLGDVVYISTHMMLYRNYSYGYHGSDLSDTGLGIIVETNPYSGSSEYLSSLFVNNQDYKEYLSSLSMFGVLVNGKVNWYSSDEIFPISPRDSS